MSIQRKRANIKALAMVKRQKKNQRRKNKMNPKEVVNKVRAEREVRISLTNIKFRSESELSSDEEKAKAEKYFILDGTPIVLDTRTCLGKDFWTGEDIFEEISKDAFDNADMTDVVFNINHGDGNHATARTRNETLELHVDKENKEVRCTVYLDKNNPRCVQTYTDISTGLLDRMSFAFTIEEESYNEKEHCYYVRKIDKVYDVSAVEFPAYETTSISARRHELAVAEHERRAAVAEEVKRNNSKKARLKALIDLNS
jgi:hypothetical protein